MSMFQSTILMTVALASGALMAKETGEEGKGATGNFFDDWTTGLAMVRPHQKTIKEASIVAGKVAVRSESRNESVLMVARNFYPVRGPGDKCESIQNFMSCYGAMIGVGLNMSGGSGGQAIDFIGLGLTVGSGTYSKASWNVGLGVGRRFNQQVLANGFKEGVAPPEGETQIRYKSIDSSAPFAFFTVRW